MGLSASQGRFLSLTAQMADLEYKAQSISNSKTRLAEQSEQVALDYSNALNKKQINLVTGFNGSTQTYAYKEATADLIMQAGMTDSSSTAQIILKDANGKVIVSQSIADAYAVFKSEMKNYANQYTDTVDSKGAITQSGLQKFLIASGTTSNKNDPNYDSDKVAYFTNIYNGIEGSMRTLGYTSDVNNVDTEYTQSYTKNSAAASYYKNLFSEMLESGYVVQSKENLNSADWLYTQITNGNVSLEKYSITGGDEGKGGFDSISYNSDAAFNVVTDDNDMAKAEAKYNYDMASIENKDKKFDLDLKNIDTEHNAKQTEIDSVKKVIDKNIERSFKTFNA